MSPGLVVTRTVPLWALLLAAACGPSSAIIGADGGRADAAVEGPADAGHVSDGGAIDGGGGADAGVLLNGGDTCAAAPDVTAGGVFRGTTDAIGVVDDYGPSATSGCPTGGTASGRDVAYALSPAVTTTYTVTVTPLTAGFDPLLYAQLTCGANACVAGTTLNGPGQPESITFFAPAGQTVYIVVDGELGSRGPFELFVAR